MPWEGGVQRVHQGHDLDALLPAVDQIPIEQVLVPRTGPARVVEDVRQVAQLPVHVAHDRQLLGLPEAEVRHVRKRLRLLEHGPHNAIDQVRLQHHLGQSPFAPPPRRCEGGLALELLRAQHIDVFVEVGGRAPDILCSSSPSPLTY